MTLTDKTIAILSATSDGDKLDPADLQLVEGAVNNRLTERGVELFEALHERVISGEYETAQRWFRGIEHLTRDAQGYVYWKGICVEHYSYGPDRKDAELASATKLAEQCRKLEEKGIPVNGRSAISEYCYNAPAGTPWVKGLLRYYSFFQRPDGQIVGIFYREGPTEGEPRVVCASKDSEGLHTELVEGAYEAFHLLANRGYASMGCNPDYETLVGWLAGTGLSPAELEQAITA